MEDQDGALFDGEPPECALEQVASFNGQVLVGSVLGLGGEKADSLRPAPATPGLVVAGVRQDPVKPRLEEVGVPQGADFAPCGQQRRLNGVVGMVEVAKD